MRHTMTTFSLRVAVLTALLVVSPLLYANNLPFAHDISIKNSGASGALAPFINDSFSPYVNPAGLGETEKQEISGLYYNLFFGSFLSSVSYVLPFLDAGTIGASLLFFSSGDTAGLNEHGQPSGSEYSESYINLTLSYGISLFSVADAGLNIKYLSHTLAGSGTSAYGIDLGAAVALPYNLRLSVFLENAIKPEFKYSATESDTLPIYFDTTLSGAYKIFDGLNDSFKAGAGITKEEYAPASEIGWHAGAEYSVYDGMAALRAGIKDSGFSFGASLSYMDATLDYALVRTAYDFVHRFSLAYSFGQNIRVLEQELLTKEDKLKYALVQKIKEDALAEFKVSVINSLTAGDAETARVMVQKALIWSPNDSWFKKQEQDINEIVNKDKKQRLLLEADKLMRDNSYIDALVVLKNILDIEPDNADAKAKFDRASQYVKTLGEKNMSVETDNKDSIKVYFETGLDLYASGEYDKAVKEWDRVIQASPLQKQVYELITTAQSKVRKQEDQSKTIVILKQQKISGLYNEAVILHIQGKFEESINIWREILKIEPDNKEAKEYLLKVTDEYKKIQRQNLEW